MNKKLEHIGKMFLNKYLNDWDIFIDTENNYIDVMVDITIRELYRALQDIFDSPDMMDKPTPVGVSYVFSRLDVKNGWTINFNGKEYNDGDII